MNICPSCGSGNFIVNHDPYWDSSDTISAEISCGDCGTVWTEAYEFKDFEITDNRFIQAGIDGVQD